MADPRPNLTTLPKEIQQMIFRHLFAGRRFSRYLKAIDERGHTPRGLRSWIKEHRRAGALAPFEHNPLAILLSCKACCIQAKEAFFRHGILNGSDEVRSLQLSMMDNKGHPKSMDLLKQVRHLHMAVWSEDPLHVFGKLPLLKTFTVATGVSLHYEVRGNVISKEGVLTELGSSMSRSALAHLLELDDYPRRNDKSLKLLLCEWVARKQSFQLVMQLRAALVHGPTATEIPYRTLVSSMGRLRRQC
jgi:hypothetical protein